MNYLSILALLLGAVLPVSSAQQQSRPANPTEFAGDTPAARLQTILTAPRIAKLVNVAAELGIADLLKTSPKSAAELAHATGTNADALYRILRAMASFGIFAEDKDGRFRLTPLAELLQSDVPGSLRQGARRMANDLEWRSWGDLMYTVKTGKPATEHTFGMSFWEYLAKHPDQQQLFNSSMDEVTRRDAEIVVKAYDFSKAARIVDIAGGQGVLLDKILRAAPQARGVLFELPAIIQSAQERIDPQLLARMELVGGDFFKAVPTGADLYILKNILHDWDEQRASEILQNTRRAMPAGARLLVIEGVVPPGNDPSPTKLTDLVMLVQLGGRERTEREHRELLKKGGFRLNRVIPMSPRTSIVEAVPE
ncbi:MAG TPA: methyltransferase [Bryobacteraceae bacterium]|nr:methyltransferase [Bryobacteraceae bacterium]